MLMKVKPMFKTNTNLRWPVYMLLVFCCCLVTGCAVPHKTSRPVVTPGMPSKFQFQPPTSDTVTIVWNTSFPSEILNQHIELFRNHNLELAAAKSRVKQAEAAYSATFGDLLPSLEGAFEFERARTKEGSGYKTEDQVGFSAALHWEVDVWGRLRYQRKAAALSVEEQRALRAQVELDMRCLLVETWLQYQSTFKMKQVLAAQYETNKEFLTLMELRLLMGQATALDVLRQRSRLIAIDRELPTVTLLNKQSANAYAVLLGQYPENFTLEEEQIPGLTSIPELSTPQQLLQDRPDLRAALYALQAADQEVAAAIANRLPQLSIDLSHSISGIDLASVGTNTISRFTAGLLAPIFQAGRLKAEHSRHKARASEALALLEQALLIAVVEVEDCLACEAACREECKLIDRQIVLAEVSVEKARIRYLGGNLSYLDVLDAIRELQALQQSEIVAQRSLLINRARLLKALGAEWSRYHETNK
jgi:NodT family efflux transporter outer membrane factor (OMF) lipoprotein